jgi:hypothetical protein
VRLVVHLEHAAYHVRIAAELRLPVRVAQHQHRRRAEVVVRVDKRAAVQRLGTEHVEEIGGDDARVDTIGLALIEQHE